MDFVLRFRLAGIWAAAQDYDVTTLEAMNVATMVLMANKYHLKTEDQSPEELRTTLASK